MTVLLPVGLRCRLDIVICLTISLGRPGGLLLIGGVVVLFGCSCMMSVLVLILARWTGGLASSDLSVSAV